MSDFIQKRLNICNACEYILKGPDDKDRCRLCGCWIKSTTKHPNSKCPLDPPKWEAEIVNEKNH
jgi:hypothetical protein